jgi:Bacterial archaeo-eukaryotic release factor family 3
MDIADIEKLAEIHGNPAVSILCRLDRRRPGNLEDPRRLDALRERAIDAVLNTYDERLVAPLLGRIEAAVASVDLAHPSDAVAILVTADESHVLRLPFPVFSRVVVDDTLATRDLVNAAQRTLRARVVVLAAERARCFDANGSSLHEVHGHGFPLHISPPVQEDTPHRDLPIGEHEQAEAHRFVLRAVDAALAELQRSLASGRTLSGACTAITLPTAWRRSSSPWHRR